MRFAIGRVRDGLKDGFFFIWVWGKECWVGSRFAPVAVNLELELLGIGGNSGLGFSSSFLLSRWRGSRGLYELVFDSLSCSEELVV